MDITIDSAFADAGIDVHLGCIRARVPAARASGDRHLIDSAVETARTLLGERKPSEIPTVAATRRAYKTLGTDPARYRPSGEALLRRAQQGKPIAAVHPVVDVNAAVSLETGLSIGTYDAAAIAPPVLFRPGATGETYAAIGRGELKLAGLPVFADAGGPFGCPTSDSTRTAVAAATTDVVMVVIGFGDAPGPADAMARAADLLRAHAGAAHVDTRMCTNRG